ncbi:MAG TPA: asparagine synthetase B, partial [Thermoanaerobaculia bacterium]|nr:asparagine synthetase B [Thermoanaerobaculia bacterium]
MCGIFGFSGPHDAELAARALALLRHRGPDAARAFAGGEMTLGATRLAIVGVANGTQPFANEDGDVVAVLNGEIYNFAPLRDELERRGHRFATDTDGEVLVHLYEEEGDALLARLEGIFAFAVWDARRRRLLLARDPMGVKPLFWTESAGRFRFASEIKALLADPGLPRRVDPRAFDAQLALGFVPGERTLFDGIRRLLPGHALVRTGDRLDIAPYWRLEVG